MEVTFREIVCVVKMIDTLSVLLTTVMLTLVRIFLLKVAEILIIDNSKSQN